MSKTLIPSLKALQAFEQTANSGNILKAAENLNLTPSAVSHQISGLEQYLNKKLFHRNGRGLSLTGAGQTYLAAIQGALHTINSATIDIVERQEREELNIHTSPTFGHLYLLPRIKKFQTQHPEFKINIQCSYENAQFNLNQVDIDIRHGIFSWTNLNVIPIRNEFATVLAHPELIKESQVKKPIDLLKQSLILSQATLIQWQQWFAYHNVELTRNLEFPFTFDRSYMSYETAKQGLGFILENSLLAEKYLTDKSLQPVFSSEFDIPITAHYIVYPYAHKKFTRVNIFTEWLLSELAQSSHYRNSL
ncbi:MAG: LysR family transcriptional regulator [[Actinobacillus] rossii]|nr:LysR family transcriptional regulator [[Actinobacillus] rossii]MDY3124121.1 LysR family transcriptional regulator [[Actinobacillus] rossii]